MTVFTDKELEYLRSQRLARLATADATGAPHVVPVGFRLSDEANAIEVGGHNFAIVIDDLASVDPWTPHGIEVRGTAEPQESGGGERFPSGFDDAWIRIVPKRVITWGIEAPPFSPAGRSARWVDRP